MFVCRSLCRFGTGRIPLQLGYPFDFSLQPQEFGLQDVRFTELPMARQLGRAEGEHVRMVLGHWGRAVNGESRLGMGEYDAYLHPCLVERVGEFRGILREAGIELKIQLNVGEVEKSSGFLEIEGECVMGMGGGMVQDFLFEREKERLFVRPRPRRVTESVEKKLRKEMEDQLQGGPPKMAEVLKEHMKPKPNLADRIMQTLQSLGKPAPKESAFTPYLLSERIQGSMKVCMTHQGQQWEETVPFDSKWLYKVQQLESEDLKRHRRRVLYDFQFWNRGNFFRVRDFAGETE